jgi:hypothetical protein
LRQVSGFLRVIMFPPPIKLTQGYNWNISHSPIVWRFPLQSD